MLDRLLATEAYAYIITFCRIGSIMFLIPFFSQPYISTKIRLLLSLTLVAMLAPAIFPLLPDMPADFGSLASLIISEIIIGLLIGTIVVIVIQTISITGSHIGLLVGLSNAVLFNPQSGDQSPLTAAFLLTAGITFLFASNLDHLIYIGMIQSYQIFIPGNFPDFGDSANAMARAFGNSFTTGLKIAAPFIVLSLLFNLLSGVLSRLMPQFQVFFVMLPLQLFGGMTLLLIILPASLRFFAKYYQDNLTAFFGV